MVSEVISAEVPVTPYIEASTATAGIVVTEETLYGVVANKPVMISPPLPE